MKRKEGGREGGREGREVKCGEETIGCTSTVRKLTLHEYSVFIFLFFLFLYYIFLVLRLS